MENFSPKGEFENVIEKPDGHVVTMLGWNSENLGSDFAKSISLCDFGGVTSFLSSPSVKRG